MDPTPDEPTASPPPSRWHAHGRPALARAISSGLAMSLAALPAALLAGELLLTVFAFAVGALGGAPGAALEARARESGRVTRAAIVCGLLLPIVGLLLSVQVVYVLGVLGGGVEHGLSRLDALIADLRREPAAMLACIVGVSLGLTLPLAHVVGLRLKEPNLSILGQAGATGIVVFVELMTIGFVGSAITLMAGRGLQSDQAIQAAFSVRPIFMALGTGGLLTAVTLLFMGLPMAALFPPALALADRFRSDRTGPHV